MIPQKRKLLIPANTYPYQNKLLGNLPGEVWKAFPDYEEYYEISNYGRIKRIRRWTYFPNIKTEGFTPEKLMSQKVFIQASPFNKDYRTYITCCFRVNKLTKHIKTARYVYMLFVKPYNVKDTGLLIQYKDNNGLNIHADNLILSNAYRRQTGTIDRKRTHFLKPVTQFTLDGKKLNFFGTLGKGARQVKGTPSGVIHALNKPPHYYKGFLWKEGDADSITPITVSPVNYPKPVIQCNLEGEELKTYHSLSEAAKAINSGTGNLRKALNKPKLTCKGFVWKWKKD